MARTKQMIAKARKAARKEFKAIPEEVSEKCAFAKYLDDEMSRHEIIAHLQKSISNELLKSKGPTAKSMHDTVRLLVVHEYTLCTGNSAIDMLAHGLAPNGELDQDIE